MYINIDINNCIKRISAHLATIWDHHDFKAVTEAMETIMQNNHMTFDDLIIHQIPQVAIGMLPAPTITNLYVAIYEQTHIIPLFNKYLFYYKRFIDDGFAVWLCDANPTAKNDKNRDDFKNIVNRSGLNWTFKTPCKMLNFMDIIIQIEEGKIKTTLYAKYMALYQYIHPNSCPPLGVLTGLIYGQILCIYQLDLSRLAG